MIKRICVAALVLALTCLSACAGANKHGIDFFADGSDEITFIFSDGVYDVYVVGGEATVESGNDRLLLEHALSDGEITPSDIVDTAESDVDEARIFATVYPDEAVVYDYESFNIIKIPLGDERFAVYVTSADTEYSDLEPLV